MFYFGLFHKLLFFHFSLGIKTPSHNIGIAYRIKFWPHAVRYRVFHSTRLATEREHLTEQPSTPRWCCMYRGGTAGHGAWNGLQGAPSGESAIRPSLTPGDRPGGQTPFRTLRGTIAAGARRFGLPPLFQWPLRADDLLHHSVLLRLY